MSENDSSSSVPPRSLGASNLAGFGRVAIFLAIAMGATFFWQQYNSVYHLAIVDPGVLFRDGARSTRELSMALDRTHAKTVVCLIDDKEMSDAAKPQFKQEVDLLIQNKLKMERIPVTLGGWPTSGDIQRFLSIAEKKENQPILIHCAQGVRRTGMFVAAYQMSILGYDKERTKLAIVTFGHSEKTINDIRRFIDGYDAANRRVTEITPKTAPAIQP